MRYIPDIAMAAIGKNMNMGGHNTLFKENTSPNVDRPHKMIPSGYD
jgi:hypothetical protein